MEPNEKRQIWDDVRSVLEKTKAVLEKSWNPDAEESFSILAERARQLAREPEQPVDEFEIELLEFELSGEHYGFEVKYVVEVKPFKNIIPIPFTPSWVMGIFSVRGRIVSVIDLREILGIKIRDKAEIRNVIILHSAEMEFGVPAESIIGIGKISKKMLQTQIHLPANFPENYFLGISDQHLIVINVKNLLSERLKIK